MAESARRAVVSALVRAAERYPDLPPSELRVAHLSATEARLAVAIHRIALQRWITLEFLLDRRLRKPASKLEPPVRAVLLAGAAQLLFMDRLPDYAVVNESVELIKAMGRPRAAGLVNAVLRKLAAMVGEIEPDEPWQPGANVLPWDGPAGPGSLVLTEPCLPPVKTLARHLSVATSHPVPLVERWLATHGRDSVITACGHGVANPPTFVAEPDSSFVPWASDHEALVAHLAQDPRRRVQDPASAHPVAATAGLSIGTALDFCAGRGTKTRQLATLHPGATIYATDVDADRRAALQGVATGASESKPLFRVVDPSALPDDPVDLLLLDVPCSNTGVLARRPEARYRFSEASLSELVDLQRQIVTELLPRLREGGWLLYSTCSLEPEENRQQREWIVATTGARVEAERATLPAGHGPAYHDGGYYALLRC